MYLRKNNKEIIDSTIVEVKTQFSERESTYLIGELDKAFGGDYAYCHKKSERPDDNIWIPVREPEIIKLIKSGNFEEAIKAKNANVNKAQAAYLYEQAQDEAMRGGGIADWR